MIKKTAKLGLLAFVGMLHVSSATEIYHKGMISHDGAAIIGEITTQCLERFENIHKTQPNVRPVEGLHISLPGIHTTTNIHTLVSGRNQANLAGEYKMLQKVLEMDKVLLSKLNSHLCGFAPTKVNPTMGHFVGVFVQPVFKKSTPNPIRAEITAALGQGMHISLVRDNGGLTLHQRTNLAHYYSEMLIGNGRSPRMLFNIEAISVDSNHITVGTVR
jgi:hypothetical protein